MPGLEKTRPTNPGLISLPDFIAIDISDSPWISVIVVYTHVCHT